MEPYTDVGLAPDKGCTQLIAGIQAEGRCTLFPGIPGSLSGKQQKKKRPQRCGGNDMPDHPFGENHCVGSAAAAHPAAIVAEYPGAAYRFFAGALVVPLPRAVPVQAPDDAAVRTGRKIQVLCKLVIFRVTVNIYCVLGTYGGLPSSAKKKSGTMRSGTLEEQTGLAPMGGYLEISDGTCGASPHPEAPCHITAASQPPFYDHIPAQNGTILRRYFGI